MNCSGICRRTTLNKKRSERNEELGNKVSGKKKRKPKHKGIKE